MTGCSTQQPTGPHADLPAETARDRWLRDLWDRLWVSYRKRVPYVAVYEALMSEHGVAFRNDHIAFRTFALQNPALGIFPLARLLDAAGYRAAGCYSFPDKHLSAIHFEHRLEGYPKIFVSQLKVWELPTPARQIIKRLVADHVPLLSDEFLSQLVELDASTGESYQSLLDRAVAWFETRPWPAPRREDVESLNAVSQYAAWVALHGYQVNHFTASINSQYGSPINTIDETVARLRAAGVPMKPDVEGAPGSPLRQSATQAATVEVEVRDGNHWTTMPWTYAYLELAERGEVIDPQTGQRRRFEGFLGPQATHLFEMTRTTQD